MKNFISLFLLIFVFLPVQIQAANPSKQRRQALQGTYLADVRAMGGDNVMARQSGKYVIQGDKISSYSWDAKKKAWLKNYTVPYKLVYYYNAGYMTGYNIVYNEPGVGEVRMCTGDVNGDKKMDIWFSDSIFYTKQ